MVEVEVWEIIDPRSLPNWWIPGSERIGKVNGRIVTLARIRALLDWFSFYGTKAGTFWKFRDEGPHAKAYAKYLRRHLEFWVLQGALEKGNYGRFGGVGYRITEEGLEILRAFIPTIKIEEVKA